MRQEEFKMERTGLVEIGQVIPGSQRENCQTLIITHWEKHMRCLQIVLLETGQIRRGKSCRVKETEKGYFDNS